MNLTGIDLFAA